MQARFLFWNIRKAQGARLLPCLTRLADQTTDVFIFAEPPTDNAPILGALNATVPNRYEYVPTGNDRVRFFSRVDGSFVGAKWLDRFSDPIYKRITAVECRPKSGLSILFIGAHLESPATGISDDGRAEWARDVASDVRLIEADAGHKRTVLVGDLNMSPYDSGLTQASALHAVMSRDLTRVVTGHAARKTFDVFYNPMWSCFGDRPHATHQPHAPKRPPGSYYFDQTVDKANPFWRLYDQLLLRPDVMDQLRHLALLDGDGTEDFITPDGKPRQNLVSDHLPIQFDLMF